MSRFFSRSLCAVVAVSAASLAAVPVAGAASPALTLSSTSASTVVSAKALKAKLTGPVGTTAQIAVAIKVGSETVTDYRPNATTLTAKNMTQSVPLSDTAVSLVRQCATVNYTVTATTADGKVLTKSGSLRKASSCSAPKPQASGVVTSRASRCEFLVGSAGRCLLPYPSNWYTRPDATSATGRRVNFDRSSTVAAGTLAAPKSTFDPAEWNRNDGFSPTPKIIVTVPGLVGSKVPDTRTAREAIATNSSWPTIGTIGNYSSPSSSVVLVDKVTGERVPIWVELDSHVTGAETPLLIHPAQALTGGRTYVVGLAGLREAVGGLVEAPAAFKALRDSTVTGTPVVEARRASFESIFSALGNAGVARNKLQLAWEFTVSSTQSLTGRMLSIRNDAFAKLGDTNLANLIPEGSSPAFTVASVTNNVSDKVARRVEGKVRVPCYLTTVGGVPCKAGSVFNYAPGAGPDATPVQNGTYDLSYRCEIPKSAFSDGTASGSALPVKPVIYGHGLLGGRGEVGSDAQVDFANQYGYIYCATDEIGFASEDVGTALASLIYLSNFQKMADRTQQGILNELYLGRALVNSGGFRTNAAFQDSSGNSLIEGNRLFYDGNSQGGILGGVVTAVSPDLDRAVLGVNGMSYSTLLDRSTDFEGYLVAYQSSYEDPLNRTLGLGMLQDIWDRAEPSGYVNHMTTNPLPNTPPHEVLMQVGFGDFQVHNITADTEARSIGASIHTPISDVGRAGPTNPGWNLQPIASYPFSGSALVYFDSGPVRSNHSGGWLGNTSPQFANVPPVKASGSTANDGADPHEHPRRSATGRAMKASFLQVNGKIIDACGGLPCYAGGWTGPQIP